MKINNSTVVVKRGDICSSKCDVIVSSDDSWISQGGGVSMAIARAGGDTIRAETRKLVPAELGDVIVTGGGNLRQKYVFHAITIDVQHWRDTISEDRESLQACIVQNSMARCFQLLLNLKMNSIALPVIGTGVARIPMDSAVENMTKVLLDELNKTNRKLRVELWAFDRPAADVDRVVRAVATSKKRVVPVGPTTIGTILGELVGDGLSWLVAKKLAGKSLAKGPKTKTEELAMADGDFNCASKAGCGGGHKVFVSYSRKDSSAAKELCEFLDREQIPYWIDFQGIPAGEEYKRRITKAIRETTFLLFLSSKNSNASENVRKEIALAVAEEKHIIPVRLDNAHYDDAIAYDIVSLDYVDWSRDVEYAKWKLRNALVTGVINQSIAASGRWQKGESK